MSWSDYGRKLRAPKPGDMVNVHNVIDNSQDQIELLVAATTASAVTVTDTGNLLGGATEVNTALQNLGRRIPAYGLRLASLAARVSSSRRERIPAGVAGPTLTQNTSDTMAGRGWHSQNFNNYTLVGASTSSVSWNSASNYLQVTANLGGETPWGWEFDFSGTQFNLAYRVAAGTLVTVWVWVDGVPVTDAPTTVSGLTAGTTYYYNVNFVSAVQKRVRIIMTQAHLRYIHVNAATDTITATPPQPWRVAIMGDSFIEGANSIASSSFVGFLAGQLLGGDVVTCGQGGTGYTAGANNFANATRLANLAASSPDLVVIVGSVNDDAQANVQTNAASCYSQLATLLPGVPVVVFGPQPTSSTTSIAANRIANITSVRTAANAASNVIAFVDMIGVTSAVTAYVGAANYTLGDRVSYQGGIYEITQTQVSAGAPNTVGYWKQVGPYFGTGNAGTPTADGNRDVVLAADGIHPTATGARVLADFIAANVVSAIQSRLLTAAL